MPRLLTVLVVEDDPDNRVVIGVALGLAGTIEVQFAETGREALARVASTDFDCVLLDPGLPDMDGLTLMPVLAALDPPPPVVIITAQALASMRERCSAAGARLVITKPFNPLTLAAEVLAVARKD